MATSTVRRPPGSRQRLVEAASRLFSRQGYQATVVKQIATEGEAPMGSFYFHFPGGKEELGVAALRHGAEGFGDLLRSTLAAHEPVDEALAAVPLVLAELLVRSEWVDGCPVATTALEVVDGSPLLRAAAAEAFQDWQDIIGERLAAGGIPGPAATGLATNALALIEGAEMLARVQATTAPLEHAAAALRLLARAATEPAPDPPR
jgi:TetR/AcrR family transcriptional regulator, lmrAB and yxaGH operons repressor